MRHIMILLFTVTGILSCSKKNDTGNAGGSPIEDMDMAKRAAGHIQRVTNPVISGRICERFNRTIFS